MLVMLRNRSRAVTSKQALMPENTSQFSPIQVYTKPIASVFNSSRFRAFTRAISPFETDTALVSPTSILDANPFIPFMVTPTPTAANKNIMVLRSPTGPSKPPKFHKPEGPLGLADLVDTKAAHHNENSHDASTIGVNKTVVLGSKLRVHIPSKDSFLLHIFDSLRSPADDGIATRNPVQGSPGPSVQTKLSTGCLSVSEMELSEDYTCVTCHGPNPKTTHIFDNQIVGETYRHVSADRAHKIQCTAKTDDFLSFCYTCRKSLDHNYDIFIYRGEKAFCSGECRYQEMLADEIEN